MRQKLIAGLVEAAMTTPGATSTDVRRAVSDRVRRRALEKTGTPSSIEDRELLSEEMMAHVDRVAERAHDVTPTQVHALLLGGLSQDAVFELTVVAAVARGVLQFERGLAALEAGG